MRAHIFATALILTFSAGVAYAHGPQLQITVDDNKIVTRQLVQDGPYSNALTSPTSVYVMPMLEFNGVWYSRPNNTINPVTSLPAFPSGPGFAYGYDQVDGGPQTFATDSVISVGFLDGLKIWNGTAFVDAGVTELKAFRGSNVDITTPDANLAITSDAGPFDSVSINPVLENYGTEGVDVHNSIRWALLGDGASPTSASPNGVYLLMLQVSSTQDGLEASDPYYFLLHKNASADAIRGAVKTLGLPNSVVQFVPEPSAMVMLTLAVFGLLPARRVRRK